MLKKMFFISTLFFMQLALCSAHLEEALPDMCPTDQLYPSSTLVRKWAFQFLAKGNYENPHAVSIVSKNCASNYPASVSLSLKKIFFNEKFFANNSIGYKRATIAHEVSHILLDHNPMKKNLTQQMERDADIKGLQLADCQSCAQEVAQHYLEERQQDLELFKSLPNTLQDFQNSKPHLQSLYIEKAKNLSETYYTTHPCGLERAFYLYQLSQTDLKGRSCIHHRLSLILKKKRRQSPAKDDDEFSKNKKR